MTNILSRSALLVPMLIALATPVAAQQARSGGTARGQTPRPHAEGAGGPDAVQAFSVVLVLGDMQTPTTQDNVPGAARKALADMKDFLPYKGYRLLDAQWTLCCAPYPMTSRLKGTDDQEYELQLTNGRAGDGRVQVRFYLAEDDASGEPATHAKELEAQLDLVRRKRAEFARKVEVGAASPTDALPIDREALAIQRELDQAKSQGRATPSHKRTVIDTTFRMDVGETVVVGTSRVKGDKALIALLTAVPSKASTGRD